GGLIGRNYSSPAASNSFWDVQTSGMSISAGGTGKTTAEMKTQTTFTDAGWDFTSLWQMTTSENDEYPFLGWQDFLPQAYAPSKGDGTAGNPYQIANLGNLYWIAVDNSRWNKHYIQTADIDASVTSTWTGGGWIPIGNAATKFTGSYKGEGHLIDGLYINREGVDHQGLFGYTNGAVISELGVINVNIIAYRRTGALVGSFEANSVMNKCYSTGFVSGGHIIGLLVGLSTYSSITNCYSRGSVNGSSTIGGLLGYNYTGSTVSNSYSTANVVGAYGNNGGLIGVEWNASTTNSFWDTETSGQLTSGGGIGKTTAEMKTSSTFLDAGWNPQIWKKEDGINDGYIYLVWQNPDGSSLFQAPILSLPVNNSTGISISPTLAWQAVSGADHYRLEINTQPDFTGTIIFDEDTLSDTSHTITGLLNNSTYYWRVQGLNNFGFSSDTSSIFSFTTKLLDAILSSPSNNSIGVGLSPTLNWLSVSGADKYKLEVNTQPDFTGTIIFNADTLTDTTQTINGLLNNSNYYWRVTALNDSGFASDISSTFLFTTKLSTAILSSPSNNSIGISLSPTLSWLSVSGADKYKLEVNTQPDFAGTIIFNADTLTDTAQTINELLNNSNYYWRITGLNNAGNTSDTSHTFSFTTLRTAVVEAIFTITDGAGGTTILTAGLDSSATDGLDSSYGEAELTPVPPAGIFDARFNFPDSIISSLKDIRQGTFGEGFNRIHELQYQVGAGSSIIINYNFGTNTPDKVRARLQDIITGALIDTTISDTGSYTVTDPSVYSKLILTMIYDTPLPVELTSFSASSSNKDVKLQWSTATETNNRGFSIERKSKNKNSWNTVAFVNGRGTTTELTNYSYTDKNVPAGIYNYRLKQVDFDGGFEYSKTVEFEVNAPKKFALEQNYPNPFNPSTIINYQIPQDGIVTLKIYDVIGGEVRTLINEFKGAGIYEVKFDASDLSSGFYIYRLKANDFILSKKMLLVK
ncbi:MAG: T9SS type A sorting domain-containing protein, partial [Ignavibacteria bacterium]